MLRPDYFYGKTDKLVEMYQDLENWIISDIATRLIKSGELSGTADRELWKLQQMGLHNTEIVKRISEMSGKSRNEVRRLLSDSVMTSFSDDKEVLTQISASDIISPLKNNMTILAMNAESYSSAVCEILDRYAESGVMVEYPTGTKRSLEAAVRCCIVTSMNQTAAQVTNVYIAQNKIEYVLVSAHPGARYDKKDPTGISSHDHWQGKAYKIIGSEPGFPNLLESTGYTINLETGKGTVVNLLGLHGYNCRHSHGPWRKDMVNKYLDENGNVNINADESQKLYDLQQKQRSLEREIRKTKREIMAKKQELDMIAEIDVKEILQPQYDKLAYKLRMQNKKLQSFCKNNDLQLQGDRTKISGFNRKQSAIANGRATAYKNKIEKNGTTKME